MSEDVDRSVRERVSARDEYEKKVKSKGFQTKEALQNSMLGLQEFMSAIDHASGNKRYIEDIPDFENPILGENRLSSVNKEEMHQVAKTQFKPLMSAVAKLSGNGKESGELYDYMFAKHGLERDAVMRQREAQKEFDKYQKANPKGTKTIGDFVASLEGKDYAGLTALTAEDGRVKSIQSQIDTIDEQMKATDDQLLLRNLGGQKKRLKVDLLNAARDVAVALHYRTFRHRLHICYRIVSLGAAPFGCLYRCVECAVAVRQISVGIRACRLVKSPHRNIIRVHTADVVICLFREHTALIQLPQRIAVHLVYSCP